MGGDGFVVDGSSKVALRKRDARSRYPLLFEGECLTFID